MHTEEIAKALRELLSRTGIGKQLDDELEAERVARVRELRAEKAASIKRMLDQRPKAEAKVAEVEKAQLAAHKAAEDMIHKYIAERAKLDTIVGTHQADLNRIDPELRVLADPRIEAFAEELRQIRDGTSTFIQRNLVFGRAANVQTHFQRQRWISAILEELERLKISADENLDIGVRLDALRAQIPEVK